MVGAGRGLLRKDARRVGAARRGGARGRAPPLPLRLAYHDACHLAHAQGVRTQPRKLLGEIPGLELLEPPEWELCCGSAGVYNMLNPEPARELGRRKAENLLSTGAEAIASANPGCSLQIASVLEEMGRGLPMYHPMEVLAMSITGLGAAKVRPSGNGARIEAAPLSQLFAPPAGPRPSASERPSPSSGALPGSRTSAETVACGVTGMRGSG